MIHSIYSDGFLFPTYNSFPADELEYDEPNVELTMEVCELSEKYESRKKDQLDYEKKLAALLEAHKKHNLELRERFATLEHYLQSVWQKIFAARYKVEESFLSLMRKAICTT